MMYMQRCVLKIYVVKKGFYSTNATVIGIIRPLWNLSPDYKDAILSV